jgi:DNA-binding MarR family transcriptional regulator
MPRRRWIPDGYVQPPSRDEVHVFVARVGGMTVGQFIICIPKDIARALGLTPQTVVEVAIRVVDEEYARREYGYVPQGFGSGKHL